MAFFQNFKFKLTGASLVSTADFTSAQIGTKFEKHNGDVFVKTSATTFKRDSVSFLTSLESDARYGQLNKLNTWSATNNFNAPLNSTGNNVFSGNNVFKNGSLTFQSNLTSNGSNIFNGDNTFNLPAVFNHNITSNGLNVFNGDNTFSSNVTLNSTSSIVSAGNNTFSGNNTFNGNTSLSLTSISSVFLPNTSGTVDIGTSVSLFRNGYFTGNIDANSSSLKSLKMNSGPNSADSFIEFYDSNTATWRTFGWSNSQNTFYFEDDTGANVTLRSQSNVAQAQAGTNTTTDMSPAAVKEAIDFQRTFSTVTQAQVGTNTTTVMSPATTKAAIDYRSIPVGSLISSASATTPSGFLPTNGAPVSRITYSALFGQIGVYFGSGDGSTTFNLPDTRGEFLRGWDNARGVDVNRPFGTWQADAFKSHTHPTVTALTPGSGVPWYTWTGTNTNYQYSSVSGATGGTETRPRNLAVNYYIKY